MALETSADSRIRGIIETKMLPQASRYEQVETELNEAAMSGQTAKLISLTREHARLREIVVPYQKRTKLQAEIDAHQALLADPAADADLKGLAEMELPDLQQQVDAINQELLNYLLAGEEAGADSVIIEIRAGTGGDEAALFARNLYEMYQRYAEKHNFKFDVMDSSPTELGGLREVVLNIKGTGIFRLLGYEGGGHRVQRVPETEQMGRVHTSAATVAVLPEAEEVDIAIDWVNDVLEHVSCAGGPGGQNVNKVASAIKLEHKATGITVSMRDERSQHKNRDKARRIMMTRLRDHFVQKEHAERSAARKEMVGSGDRNARVRTYNFPQNRCTDHRVNENYSLEKIIAGELDPMIADLQRFDRERKLSEL